MVRPLSVKDEPFISYTRVYLPRLTKSNPNVYTCDLLTYVPTLISTTHTVPLLAAGLPLITALLAFISWAQIPRWDRSSVVELFSGASARPGGYPLPLTRGKSWSGVSPTPAPTNTFVNSDHFPMSQFISIIEK